MAGQTNTAAKRRRIAIGIGLAVVLLGLIGWAVSRLSIAVLQPAGPIAAGEKKLLVTAFLMMLLVAVPVLVLAFWFAWRYREDNPKAGRYTPDWDHDRRAETIWWLIPGVLILIIAVITWRGTYAYDPYKPLASTQPALQVQVVALQWRWLFIYPDEHVASVNELHLPVGRPVTFHITADAPMNSFWIPQLAGQIYAMPGMDTQLNLEADKAGTYYASSANISGKGFADMHFNVMATSSQDFADWVDHAQAQAPLTQARYTTLAKPTDSTSVRLFGDPADSLYGTIVMKYMNMPQTKTQTPATANSATDTMQMPGMDMENM